MTVSVLRNKVQYGGNSSTTQFTVNFPYTEKSQILVYLNDTLQTITTHYTLTDPDSTGTVTFVTAPATGTLVTILRETDFLQTTDYANNDILDAETLEAAFDKLTMMCQQVKNLADKAIGFDETVNDTDTTSLKLAAGTADLAGKLLAFDSTGAFVTTQEIGTFRGSDSTTTTASYVVRDLIRDSSNDNVYFTKVNASAGTSLTNTTYFELLVDVETVRTLKEAAETAKTGAETAETNAEAALASFQGQYKTGATNPYSGTPDPGDLWYDSTNSILKYYVSGTGFEPVTTSLATVTGNYLTISNQVITAGVVPVSLGGTGGTSSSEARTLLGLSIGSDIQAYSVSLQDISLLAKTDGNIIVGDGSNWVAESGSTARASLGVSIGSQVQAWDKQLDDISALAVTDGNIIVGNGTTWVAESGATARASLGLTIGTDVEAYSSTNADYSDTTANFTGTLQNGGSNVVVDSDIGSSVQAYDADLTAIAGLSSADGNFIVGSATGWVVESGATVRTSLGLAIGTDVQAYDADTAKYDDTTANFTGTLQNGGSNVLVDSDIGSTVQAAGSYLSDVVSDTTPQLGGNLDVNGSSIVSVSAGNISITPDTTGQIILDGLSWPTADGTTGQV
ncbi:MAG: phage tail fiber protein, partial [bacterium]